MFGVGPNLVPTALWNLEASVPDSAHVAGTTFSCALIEDDRKLHLVPGLELQAILHLFDVEKQPLALTHFVCDETKLREKKKKYIYIKLLCAIKMSWSSCSSQDSFPPGP